MKIETCLAPRFPHPSGEIQMTSGADETLPFQVKNIHRQRSKYFYMEGCVANLQLLQSLPWRDVIRLWAVEARCRTGSRIAVALIRPRRNGVLMWRKIMWTVSVPQILSEWRLSGMQMRLQVMAAVAVI